MISARRRFSCAVRARRPARVLGGLLLLAAAAFSATAFAGSSYTDPSGDSTQALDITTVGASESPDGRLTVTVGIGNRQALPADSRIDIWFDLDNNARTGDEGDEALVRYVTSGTITFSRWDGDEMVTKPKTGMSGRFADGTLTFVGPKSAFDSVSSFGLLVITRGTNDDLDGYAYDGAPEVGRYGYVAPGPSTWTDRSGDIPIAADVTGVRVADAKDGTITFSIALVGDVPTTGDSGIDVYVDRDLASDGKSEVYLGYRAGKLTLSRRDSEGDWVSDTPPTRARATVTNGNTLVLTVHRSELDDVARFGLYVYSYVEDEEEDEIIAVDRAPGEGRWTYKLANRPPLRLIVGEIYGTPARPKAGRPFVVNVPVKRSDTSQGLTSGTAACNVLSGGKKIRAKGSVKSGLATCRFVVPRRAVDVRGSMIVRSAGLSVTAWFAGAIDFGGGVGGL